MSSFAISLTPDDDVSILFGPQDVHLKKLREQLAINIVHRGDQLICEGADERQPRAKEVLDELLAVARKQRTVSEGDLNRTLKISETEPVSENAKIDLFERARAVRPRTKGQEVYVEAIRKADLVFATGPAGCGKTYLAVAMALNALRRQSVRKIVLVRPAVEAGEKIGFLPGDMLAKVNPFLRPLLDAMGDMIDYEQVKRYMEQDIIEIVPLAFMRGRTLSDTFIILDEGQNTTITQIKMFLTRMGEGSKIVVTGDPTQTDLPPHVPSGIVDAIYRLKHIEGVMVVELTGKDIVRHRLVREIVAAYDDEESKRKNRRS